MAGQFRDVSSHSGESESEDRAAPVLNAEDARQASIALKTRRQKFLVLGILTAIGCIPLLVIFYFIVF